MSMTKQLTGQIMHLIMVAMRERGNKMCTVQRYTDYLNTPVVLYGVPPKVLSCLCGTGAFITLAC